MNLLFLYGPPASGKLTIASALAEQTGYKLFHNHMTQDLAGSIYPELNDLRYKLVEKLRLDVFEYAAKNNTNLVYTQFYTGDADDRQFVEDAVRIVTENDGTVYFVHITAPLEILRARVINESRKKHGKAQDIQTLDTYLATLSKDAHITHENSIEIDSSKQSALASSRIIQDTFALQ